MKNQATPGHHRGQKKKIIYLEEAVTDREEEKEVDVRGEWSSERERVL